jgi:hypothetical protein
MAEGGRAMRAKALVGVEDGLDAGVVGDGIGGFEVEGFEFGIHGSEVFGFWFLVLSAVRFLSTKH